MNNLVKLARAHLGNKLDGKLDWRTTWQELNDLTYGLIPGDSHLEVVMQEMNRCHTCFLEGDWEGFQRAARQVHNLVKNES